MTSWRKRTRRSQPILLTNNGKNFNKSKSGTGGGIPITALTRSVPNHRLRHRRQVRAARDCSRLAVSRRSRETRRHSALLHITLPPCRPAPRGLEAHSVLEENSFALEVCAAANEKIAQFRRVIIAAVKRIKPKENLATRGEVLL